MAEINSIDIPLEEKENVDNQSQAIKKRSAADTKLSSHALKSLLFFGSTGALIFFVLLAILPVIQIIIGQSYANQCPVEPYIPKYQSVSGAVGLTNIILILIVGILSAAIIKPTMKAAESDSGNDLIFLGVGYSCIVCFIIFILALLSTFMTIWTIFGLVWTFGPWNTVQYIDPNQVTYCHPTLYRFNYWLFILPLILGPVIFCLPFCIACCAFFAMKDKGTPVPTTEA